MPTFLRCLHGSHSLLQGDLLDAFGIKVGQPKKDHEGSQAVSKVTATWIDGCSLYQVVLRSRGFPLPILADGKHLLGTSWIFLDPRNV